MANEGVMLRDGALTVAAANYYNPSVALAGPNGSGQYLAVKISAPNTITLANTGGEAIYGILQNTPEAGSPAHVAIIGCSKAVAGAVISAGAALMTDTSGRLIPATSTNHVVGQAITAASAAGVLFDVEIYAGGYTAS